MQEPIAEPQQASGVFMGMLGEAGLDPSTMRAAEAWAVFVEFSRIPFAVPQLPDADGLMSTCSFTASCSTPRPRSCKRSGPMMSSGGRVEVGT